MCSYETGQPMQLLPCIAARRLSFACQAGAGPCLSLLAPAFGCLCKKQCKGARPPVLRLTCAAMRVKPSSKTWHWSLCNPPASPSQAAARSSPGCRFSLARQTVLMLRFPLLRDAGGHVEIPRNVGCCGRSLVASLCGR